MKLIKDFEEIMAEAQRKRKVWKLVLTGGPCGGKTTCQTRLATFFENLGWKVYRVPETANILLSGGVNFAELDDEAAERFQVRKLELRTELLMIFEKRTYRIWISMCSFKSFIESC